MTVEPRDGFEAVWLRIYRQLSPRERRAGFEAMDRMIDGQPLDDSMVEMLVELGDTPDEARRKVREARANPAEWRNLLD
jgi:hypothetical protein